MPAAVDVDRFVVLARGQSDRLGATMREAVNASALIVTTAARRELDRTLHNGRQLRGYKNKGRGNRKVNAYYREADSHVHPTALVAARGPAHLIEHPIRAHWIRPRPERVSVSRSARQAAATFDQATLRISTPKRRRTALGRPGATSFPHAGDKRGARAFTAQVRVTGVRRTSGPIGRTFARAPGLIDAKVRQIVRRDLERGLAAVGVG